MMRRLSIPLLLAASPVLAGPDDAVTRINAVPARDGWFVCDAIAGPWAAFAGKPDAGGTSLITLLDRRSGRFDTQAYQVGRADAGAGQIFWALSRSGKAVGSVHGVNPGMIDDDGASVPPITSMAVDGRQLDCRFLTHTRFLGVDSRRSVVVTQGAAGLLYQSFDFRRRGAVTHPDGVQRSNAPTLRIMGGSETPAGFRFVNGGYTYLVTHPATGEAAEIRVAKGGGAVQAEKLVGFTYAPPASAIPVPPLGADAVWSTTDLDACRAKPGATSIDACLVATMKRTGATPASIAFTQRLIAKNMTGYISGWKQAGPIGIATITYPFRANTNEGTVLIPVGGDPIDVDAYQLGSADKARADYRAAQAVHPNAFPVPPGEVTIGKGPSGSLRILVTTPTADCHACAPNGSVVVGYDFDPAGHFLGASLAIVA
ncbi:MAG: hypothetical protein JWO65_59 [Sphingomonas bacterium]|nr:hypothetical protein [Sphingomonas bacterium]